MKEKKLEELKAIPYGLIGNPFAEDVSCYV